MKLKGLKHMKKKIIETVKSILGLDDLKKVSFFDIPWALKKNVLFFASISLVIFLISIWGGFSSGDYLFWGTGGVVALCLGGYALYLSVCFCYCKYVLIVGRCIDRSVHKVRRDNSTVYIKNDQGIIYQFTLLNRGRSYIRQGDLLNIYACGPLSVYEKDGAYIIGQYYTAVKAPIKDQVA